MWKKTIPLLLIAWIHFSVSVISWSYHPANAAAQTLDAYAVVWKICSFPLITYMPYQIVSAAFLSVLFLNSCLWAIVLFIIIKMQHHSRRTRKA